MSCHRHEHWDLMIPLYYSFGVFRSYSFRTKSLAQLISKGMTFLSWATTTHRLPRESVSWQKILREQHSPNDSSWCPLHCSQLMPLLSLSLGNCLLHVIMMVTTDNQHYFTSLLRGEWTAWEKNSCEKRRISCRFLFSYTKYFKWLFGRQFWQHFSSIIKMRHYSSSCQTVIDILSEEWTHILTGLCRFLSPFLSLWCWAWWMFMAPLVGMHEKGEIKGKRGRRCKRLLLSQRERERKRQLMRRSDFNYDINNGRA